jgi:hypothetical protein
MLPRGTKPNSRGEWGTHAVCERCLTPGELQQAAVTLMQPCFGCYRPMSPLVPPGTPFTRRHCCHTCMVRTWRRAHRRPPCQRKRCAVCKRWYVPLRSDGFLCPDESCKGLWRRHREAREQGRVRRRGYGRRKPLPGTFPGMPI